MHRFTVPFKSVVNVIGWVIRDPARPHFLGTFGLATGIVVAQYFQTFLILVLMTVFSSGTAGAASSLSIGEFNLGAFIPKVFFQSHPLAFASSLTLLFMAQSLVSFVCRKGLVDQAMSYYKSHATRAANYYGAGLIGSLPTTDLLIDKDMLTSFCLREARYLGTGFLSLANALTGLIASTTGILIVLKLDWQLTLILMGVVLSLVGLLMPFVTSGTKYSRDILEGSGDMAKEVRQHLVDAALYKGDSVSLQRHLTQLTELPGATRFLEAFKKRIILSYRTNLGAQLGFALLFGIVAAIFLHRFNAGTMAARDITTYCIFLLPLFSATSSITNALIGITASRPYFENYFMIFGDARKQADYSGVRPSSHAQNVTQSPTSEDEPIQAPIVEGLTRENLLVLCPLDTLDLPVFQRLLPILTRNKLVAVDRAKNHLFLPDIWPSRARNVGAFLGLSEELDFNALMGTNKALAKIFAKDLENIKLAQHSSGGIDLSKLTGKECVLLGLSAAVQSGRDLILSTKSFTSIPEGERNALLLNIHEFRILLIAPRIPKINIKPSMDHAFALSLQGNIVTLNPADVLNLPPELASSLRKESFTFVGGDIYDPELMG